MAIRNRFATTRYLADKCLGSLNDSSESSPRSPDVLPIDVGKNCSSFDNQIQKMFRRQRRWFWKQLIVIVFFSFIVNSFSVQHIIMRYISHFHFQIYFMRIQSNVQCWFKFFDTFSFSKNIWCIWHSFMFWLLEERIINYQLSGIWKMRNSVTE